jgi:hypothetical protein
VRADVFFQEFAPEGIKWTSGWPFEFDDGVHSPTEAGQGNVKSFAEPAALGKDIPTEALITKFNEKIPLLEYLFNFRFGNRLALAGLTYGS